MRFITYKDKEGVPTRLVAWILTSLLALFGCLALYYYKDIIDITQAGGEATTWWGYSLLEIPFFNVHVRLGLLICLVIFVIAIALLNRFLINKPAPADFLIDTEYEVRKVSWPSRPEYWGSSVAVIVSVIIIGLFIFIVDIILTKVTSLLYLH